MNILDVGTARGTVTVNEADLATVTDAELKKSGIDMTREELLEAFAQGVKLTTRDERAGVDHCPAGRGAPVGRAGGSVGAASESRVDAGTPRKLLTTVV